MKKWEKLLCLWLPFLFGAPCALIATFLTAKHDRQLAETWMIFTCSAFILMSIFCACVLLCQILKLVEGMPYGVRQLQASERK